MFAANQPERTIASRRHRWRERLGATFSHIDNPVAARIGLMRLIREDLRRHGLDIFAPGFRALAAYRFGAWARTFRPGIVRIPLLLLHGILFRYSRNLHGIEIYSSARIGRRLLVGHQHGIVIHRFATFGDDCLVRHGVTLGEAGVGRDNFAAGIGPIIGCDVDIGAGAKIIGNVRIGDRARIGPNAVIMTDIPADATVLAPPARIMPRAAPPQPYPQHEEQPT